MKMCTVYLESSHYVRKIKLQFVNLQKVLCKHTGHRNRNAQGVISHLVSGWLDSNCLRCWDKSFFSRDSLIHALARPTSVLISLMFWICLKNRSNRKDLNPKNNLELEKNSGVTALCTAEFYTYRKQRVIHNLGWLNFQRFRLSHEFSPTLELTIITQAQATP